MDTFSDHVAAFARALEESISAIAEQIEAAPPSQPFDAVFGVCSEGLLLPGIAERAARRLGGLVPRTATQMDIGNGGCTASVRAIQLVKNLDPEIRNVLILAIEPTLDPRRSEMHLAFELARHLHFWRRRRWSLDFGRTGRRRPRSRGIIVLER